MMEWLQSNWIELFSGFGTAAVVGFCGWLFKKRKDEGANKQHAKSGDNSPINQANGDISIKNDGEKNDK